MGKVRKRFLKKGLKVYNPLVGKGDMAGKDHLIELYTLGYPVIPTVDSIMDLHKLPKTKYYFIKPKDSCDAIGTHKVTLDQLRRIKLNNHVIQPYIYFKCEVSFYVIDGEIIYSFSTPKKTGNYKIATYKPTKNDVNFVRKFVRWNDMPYGLQRIDTCRTKDGKLLLMEIEDFSRYLQLLECGKKNRNKMLKALVKSIKRVV